MTNHGPFGDVFSDDAAHRVRIREGRPQRVHLCRADWRSVAPSSIPGVWTTFILVSLGVPFWQGLLGLRPKIGEKTRRCRVLRVPPQSWVNGIGVAAHAGAGPHRRL